MIITISGQYGSGGNEVGMRLAEIMGYRVFDAQLIVRAREIYTQTGMRDDRPSWWPNLSLKPYDEDDIFPSLGTALGQAELELKSDQMTSDSSFAHLGSEADHFRRAMLESLTGAVMECSEGGDCILFGKCSDFILRGVPDTIHVFSTADMDVRISRIMSQYNLNLDNVGGSQWLAPSYTLQEAGQLLNMERRDALELMYTTDKRRADLFEFLTGERWGDLERFDYHIVGDELNLDVQTSLLLEFVRKKMR
ncbi:MAG: cytidylate kinase-like family protein [Oscillospiraceae bacterium]|nr:cytidylate kinase-like family protein [Oscillospiraceae bacterium]